MRKVGFPGATPEQVGFLTGTVFGFLFILDRVRIIRIIHYRMGVSEYNF